MAHRDEHSAEPSRASLRGATDPLAAIADEADELLHEALRSERRALAFGAIAAVAVIAWIAMPVGVGILLGTLMAFAAQPLYDRLRRRTGHAGLTALMLVAGTSAAVTATAGALGYLFATKGVVMARALLALVAPAAGGDAIATRIAAQLSRFGVQSASVTAKLQEVATSVAGGVAAAATAVMTVGADAVLAMFFAMLTMNLMLRHWRDIAVTVEQVLPLRPAYTRALIDEFRSVGRTTLLGTIVTGVAQGVFAAAGYALCGVPEPLFFGAATAAASLIPGVGTLLVWVPAGVVLIATGHPGRGIAELIWGAVLVVGVCDYVIRPRLVGGRSSLPELVTFVGLFGGVEALGLKGLIVGPVVIALAVAVLKIYAREVTQRRGLARRIAG